MGFYKKPLPGKAFTILFHLALSQVLHQHTQVYTRNYEKIITTDLPPFEGTRQPLVFFFSQLRKNCTRKKSLQILRSPITISFQCLSINSNFNKITAWPIVQPITKQLKTTLLMCIKYTDILIVCDK